MAKSAAQAAYDLGKLAVDETGMGRVHYKVLKARESFEPSTRPVIISR